MRSIGLLSSFLLCAVAYAGAPGPTRLTEPVFGLKYDPALVSFEAAPAELTKRCPDLTNSRWDRKMWIFGRSGSSASEFLVVGGFYVRRHGSATMPVEYDTPGAVVHLRGDHCELIGPAREVFDYAPEGISKPELADLAKDASCRYARAFGGSAKFAAALQQQHISLDGPRSGLLKQVVSHSGDCRELPGHL